MAQFAYKIPSVTLTSTVAGTKYLRDVNLRVVFQGVLFNFSNLSLSIFHTRIAALLASSAGRVGYNSTVEL